MEGSLLSHIAGSFITQYENVANSSLCYMLNRYPAAQKALKKVLTVEDVPTRYMTEVSTKCNGRPDVTGLDAAGGKAVIIEGKFWANLTDNQPANYLRELNASGKLLFLCPERRVTSLRSQIRTRLGGESERIVVCPWMTFLKLVESENSREHEADLAADLRQLNGLCGKLDEEGMPPLSMTDLDPMNGRICYQFASLIDDCNGRLRTWGDADFAGSRSTAWMDGYGFYFRAFGFDCLLSFHTSRWFKSERHAPFWLRINTTKWNSVSPIFRRPGEYDAEQSYSDSYAAWYALTLRPGMDRGQIIDSIEQQVRLILSGLRQAVDNPKETTVVGD